MDSALVEFANESGRRNKVAAGWSGAAAFFAFLRGLAGHIPDGRRHYIEVSRRRRDHMADESGSGASPLVVVIVAVVSALTLSDS